MIISLIAAICYHSCDVCTMLILLNILSYYILLFNIIVKLKIAPPHKLLGRASLPSSLLCSLWCILVICSLSFDLVLQSHSQISNPIWFHQNSSMNKLMKEGVQGFEKNAVNYLGIITFYCHRIWVLCDNVACLIQF